MFWALYESLFEYCFVFAIPTIYLQLFLIYLTSLENDKKCHMTICVTVCVYMISIVAIILMGLVLRMSVVSLVLD